jgi:hypothetical protein
LKGFSQKIRTQILELDTDLLVRDETSTSIMDSSNGLKELRNNVSQIQAENDIRAQSWMVAFTGG